MSEWRIMAAQTEIISKIPLQAFGIGFLISRINFMCHSIWLNLLVPCLSNIQLISRIIPSSEILGYCFRNKHHFIAAEETKLKKFQELFISSRRLCQSCVFTSHRMRIIFRSSLTGKILETKKRLRQVWITQTSDIIFLLSSLYSIII